MRVAADLVNSVGSVSGTEYLATAEDLRGFLREHDMAAPRVTAKDLEEVREVRQRLRGVFEAPTERQRARLVNELLEHAGTLPQITDHDGEWHLHYVPTDAPVARRLAGTAAMGLAVVLAHYGHDRVGVCEADRCRDVYVDTSRNRSRRYCDETCATRMNVAAYRARKKQAT